MKEIYLLIFPCLSYLGMAQNRDKICALPPVKGSCGSSFPMWYFNVASQQCESFEFSGCNGNSNRFENKIDCERFCIPTRDSSSITTETTSQTDGYSNDCNAPKDSGVQCAGFARAIPNLSYRWYWNQDKFACLSFKYNGCGGNTNNFPTHTMCIKRCQPMDGPVCLSGTENSNYIGQSCRNLTCPVSHVCKMGAFFSTCCDRSIESDGKCPDGSTIMQHQTKHFALAESCDDLSCPSGFQCIMGTMYARCCSMAKPEKPTNPPFSL